LARPAHQTTHVANFTFKTTVCKISNEVAVGTSVTYVTENLASRPEYFYQCFDTMLVMHFCSHSFHTQIHSIFSSTNLRPALFPLLYFVYILACFALISKYCSVSTSYQSNLHLNDASILSYVFRAGGVDRSDVYFPT